MRPVDIIKERMEQNNYSVAQLASDLGYSHHSGVSERLRNSPRGMSVDLFAKMLEALSCELYVVSTTGDDASWKVTP